MAKKIHWNEVKPGMELLCENWQGNVKLRVNGLYNDVAMVSMTDFPERKSFLLRLTPDMTLKRISFWDTLKHVS